jgi:peptidoglycan/LPS O-acetylase OafA/YrhL
MNKTLDTNYKYHIQGLRGISVLLVFLYHCKIELFSNGYLGVDIFFVISGFVITQAIYKDYLNDKFSIDYFFIKRIKRIVPNLFFIITFTYAIYIIFGPPDLSLWPQTISSLFGVSNLWLLNNKKNYFDNIFDDPLGHTWSLGVEEQFYLVYPFLIFFFFKTRRKITYSITALIIIITITLASSLYLEKIKPEYVFYLSPLRFWEFAFGCLIFFISKKNKQNNYLAYFFLIIILIIIFAPPPINYINISYILKNILIVFASGFFIYYSNEYNFIGKKYLASFGNISYSFYLWHLPIIFFLDLYINTKEATIIGSFFLTLILSILSYRYIENFFKNYKYKNIKIIKFIIIILILSLSSLIYIKYFNNNLRESIRNFFYKINYLEIKHNWNQRMIFENIKISDKKIYEYCTDKSIFFNLDENNLKKECLKNKDNEILFFIEGDSHTAQFVTAFNEINEINNLYYKHTYNYEFNTNILNNLSQKYKKIIYVTDVNDIKKLNIIKNEYVNLAKNINILFFNSTPNTLSKSMPFKCIVSQTDCSVIKQEDLQTRDLNNLFNELNIFQKLNNNRIKIFDSYNELCPGYSCKVYDKKNDIIYYRDKTHLTIEGAKLLTPSLKGFIYKVYLNPI